VLQHLLRGHIAVDDDLRAVFAQLSNQNLGAGHGTIAQPQQALHPLHTVIIGRPLSGWHAI